MEAQQKKIVDLYRNLAEIPAVSNALITPLKSGYTLNITWSQRNLEIGKRVQFRKTYFIDQGLTQPIEISTADVTKELLTVISRDGKIRAVVREEEIKSESKQFLEIWNETNLHRSVDIAALELHGSIYTDAEFRSFDLSPDGSQLLYVAEKKVPKSEAFYKRKATKTSDGDSAKDTKSDEKIKPGNEYLYRQDWGENLVGKVQSVICIYDIPTDQVTVLTEGFPVSYCPAQVQWASDGKSVYGCAFFTKPRRLGLYACTNRDNEIFNYTLDGKYRKLSGANRCVRSPRLSPNGDFIVWLERRVGGPHRMSMALMGLKLPANTIPTPELIIPIAEDNMEIENDGLFYGVFCTDLPQRCFSSDGKRVCFSTPKLNNEHSYCVDLTNGKIQELTMSYDLSRSVIDVFNDVIITIETDLKTPHQVSIAKLPTSIEKCVIKPSEWLKVSKSIGFTGLEKYEYKNMSFKHENSPDKVTEFSGVYFGPTNISKTRSVPLIVSVHGGPHACFSNGFALSYTLNASLGFAYLFVNYRGSIGFGQNTVDFLPTRVGKADVEDVVLATKQCLAKNVILDPSRVIIAGGSHGGFLSLHLSGQYPDLYRAVVSLNPVVDIASMQITSDIPDWCTVNAGSEYTQKGPLNESLMVAQRNHSPIIHAHNVKAPTLLLIGSKDLRVPPSQGTEMYQRLKANGVNVKMHLYEDNHSLQTVPVELDVQINQTLWMLEHTAH